MAIFILVFVIFILLDIAAIRWGYDSRDGIDSAEWKRRQEWERAHLTWQD